MPEISPAEEPEISPTEEPEISPVEEPGINSVEESEISSVKMPELSPAEEPEIRTVEEPEISPVEELEICPAEEPEISSVEEPEIRLVEEPEISSVKEPEIGSAEEPEISPIEEPEISPVDGPELRTVEEPEIRAIKESNSSPTEEPERSAEAESTAVEEPERGPFTEVESSVFKEPERSPVEEPESSPVEEPNNSPTEEPERSAEAESTVVEEPERGPFTEVESSVVEEPERSPVEEPERSLVEEPEFTNAKICTIEEPESTTVGDLEISTAEELEVSSGEEPEINPPEELNIHSSEETESSINDKSKSIRVEGQKFNASKEAISTIEDSDISSAEEPEISPAQESENSLFVREESNPIREPGTSSAVKLPFEKREGSNINRESDACKDMLNSFLVEKHSEKIIITKSERSTYNLGPDDMARNSNYEERTKSDEAYDNEVSKQLADKMTDNTEGIVEETQEQDKINHFQIVNDEELVDDANEVIEELTRIIQEESKVLEGDSLEAKGEVSLADELARAEREEAEGMIYEVEMENKTEKEDKAPKRENESLKEETRLESNVENQIKIFENEIRDIEEETKEIEKEIEVIEKEAKVIEKETDLVEEAMSNKDGNKITEEARQMNGKEEIRAMEETGAIGKNDETESKDTVLKVENAETLKEKVVTDHKLAIKNVERSVKKDEIKSIKEEIAEAEEKENERIELMKGEATIAVDDYVRLMEEDVRMMEKEMRQMEEKMELIESAIKVEGNRIAEAELENQAEEGKHYSEIEKTTHSEIQADTGEMDEATRLLQVVDKLIKVVESGVHLPVTASEDVSKAGRVVEELKKTGITKDAEESKLTDQKVFTVEEAQQHMEDKYLFAGEDNMRDTLPKETELLEEEIDEMKNVGKQNEVPDQEKHDMSYEILEIEDACENINDGIMDKVRGEAKLPDDSIEEGTSDKKFDEVLMNTLTEKTEVTLLTENVKEIKNMAFEAGETLNNEREANRGEETNEDYSMEDDEEWEDALENLKYPELEKTLNQTVEVVADVKEDLENTGADQDENKEITLIYTHEGMGKKSKEEDDTSSEDEMDEHIVYNTASDETVQNTESEISQESEDQGIRDIEERSLQEAANEEVQEQERSAQLEVQALVYNIIEHPAVMTEDSIREEYHEGISVEGENEDKIGVHNDAAEEQNEERTLNKTEATQGKLDKDDKSEFSEKEDTMEELKESDISESDEEQEEEDLVRYELMIGRSDEIMAEREKEMFKNMIWSVIMEEPEHEAMEDNKSKNAEKQDEAEARTTIIANELFERLIQEKEVDFLRNVRAADVSRESEDDEERVSTMEEKDAMADVDLNDEEQSSTQETSEDRMTPEDSEMELLMKDMENKTHGYEKETRKNIDISEHISGLSESEAEEGKTKLLNVKEAIAKAKEEETKKKQESLVKSLEAMVKMKQEKKELTDKEVKSVLSSVLRFLRYLFCCWSIENPAQ